VIVNNNGGQVRSFFSDFPSYYYLLKRGLFQDLYSFFYAKAVVPTGEGSRGWLYKPFIEPLVKRYPNLLGMPRYVEIETTTLCDRQCKICELMYWKKGDQVRRHMTLSEFKKIMGSIPSLKWCNVTGEGSSFLNPDYPLMLKYLYDKGVSVWLVDHLDSIPFDQLYWDMLPFVHGIYLSMDAATKKTYEKIKVGCNYDNVLNVLKELVEYKQQHKTPFPHIAFRYIITKDNVHEMPQFLDLINSIASRSVWGGSSTYVEFTGLLGFSEIRHMEVKRIPEKTIKELKKRGKGIPFMFSHPEQSTNPPIEQCTAWREPYIMMPGYVIPCCAVLMSNNRPFLRRCSFGNLFQSDFKTIWYSSKYHRFRDVVCDSNKPVPEVCVGCRAYRTEERVEKQGIWEMQEEVKEIT